MTKQEQIDIINSENVEYKRENTIQWYDVDEIHYYDFVHNFYRVKGTELDKSVENYIDSTTNKTYKKSYLSGAIFIMDKIKEISSDEEMSIEDKYSMVLQFIEENYRIRGLSDDGFIDLITYKVVDDFIKNNDQILNYWNFLEWVLKVGYGDILCDLMTSTVRKNNMDVLTWNYKLYVSYKKEIKESPTKFFENHKYKFSHKQKKIDKLIAKRIN